MKYTRYTDQELREINLIPEGTYQFEVLEVHEQDRYGEQLRDSQGNDMAKLKLKVWDKNGKERYMFTNLFGDGRMAFRTKHFADCVGQIDRYDANTFDVSETVGETGFAEIIVRKGGPKKDGSGMWDDSNDVKDFLKKAMHTNVPPMTAAAMEFNDDITF